MRDRHDLQFVSGADACAAWLYPAARDAVDDTGPAPIIVPRPRARLPRAGKGRLRNRSRHPGSPDTAASKVPLPTRTRLRLTRLLRTDMSNAQNLWIPGPAGMSWEGRTFPVIK